VTKFYTGEYFIDKIQANYLEIKIIVSCKLFASYILMMFARLFWKLQNYPYWRRCFLISAM